MLANLVSEFKINNFIKKNLLFRIRQLIRQKLLFDKPVEIFSLYAEKHAKKASNVHHDNDEGRNQRDPLPADPPRHMILDDMTYDPPHMPHPLPSRTPVGKFFLFFLLLVKNKNLNENFN